MIKLLILAMYVGKKMFGALWKIQDGLQVDYLGRCRSLGGKLL